MPPRPALAPGRPIPCTDSLADGHLRLRDRRRWYTPDMDVVCSRSWPFALGALPLACCSGASPCTSTSAIRADRNPAPARRGGPGLKVGLAPAPSTSASDGRVALARAARPAPGPSSPSRSAVARHAFTPVLRGRGGKGVATTFGAWVGLLARSGAASSSPSASRSSTSCSASTPGRTSSRRAVSRRPRRPRRARLAARHRRRDLRAGMDESAGSSPPARTCAARLRAQDVVGHRRSLQDCLRSAGRSAADERDRTLFRSVPASSDSRSHVASARRGREDPRTPRAVGTSPKKRGDDVARERA